jgi:hypothetical protein
MPALGRRVHVDVRDHAFLLRRKLADVREVSLPARKTWGIAPIALDQGETSTCVGHAWRNFLRCAPMRTEKSGPSAFDLYRAAVLLDPFRENDYEAQLPDHDPGLATGSTIRAGAQAVRQLGRLKSFLWAFELQPAIEWVLTQGPVVLGTEWYASMNRPDREGIVRIGPGARSLGGHAYLWRGVDTKRALALCSNSWGDSYGRSGDFLIPLRDMERLIRDGGECCTAIEAKLKSANGASNRKQE